MPARAQTNGNKPPVNYLTAFTERVAQFPRVAYYPLGGGKCETAVAMVIDEILVGEKAAQYAPVRALLRKQAIDTKRTVFGGLKQPPSEDVQIWRLRKTPGNQHHPDVAMLIWEARNRLKKTNIPPEQVAPNHVLIPSNYHTCPGGPPEPWEYTRVLPPRKKAPRAVDVVVIDSGYVADGPAKDRIDVLERGQWFSATPVPGSPGQFRAPYKWTAEPEEPLYVTVYEAVDGRQDHLATLVAHANFVAGVIAQACKQARIILVNHNGALLESPGMADTPIPTEASVARSLWTHRKAAVINVGFAFATLPNAALLANTVDRSGPPSWTFELVLNQIDIKKTVVVAPAGNQACPTRQYPAAFHLNPAHRNVIGVGSISPSGGRSVFSNYGPWVACCTKGENVRSTFITHWTGPMVDGMPTGAPTEDAEPDGSYPPYPAKKFTSGWARWSGTSFAAPKVAAAIARRVVQGQSPFGAWLALAAAHSTIPVLAMGKFMPELPPTA